MKTAASICREAADRLDHPFASRECKCSDCKLASNLYDLADGFRESKMKEVYAICVGADAGGKHIVALYTTEAQAVECCAYLNATRGYDTLWVEIVPLNPDWNRKDPWELEGLHRPLQEKE